MNYLYNTLKNTLIFEIVQKRLRSLINIYCLFGFNLFPKMSIYFMNYLPISRNIICLFMITGFINDNLHVTNYQLIIKSPHFKKFISTDFSSLSLVGMHSLEDGTNSQITMIIFWNCFHFITVKTHSRHVICLGLFMISFFNHQNQEKVF